jgi:hypothetical protein
VAGFEHFEFYKELYFKENERRTEIESSLNVPLAIITALVAGIYILATTYPTEATFLVDICFWAGLTATFLVLALSVYFLVLAFSDATNLFEVFSANNRFSYKGIPYPQGLFNWHQNLDRFYRQTVPNDPNLSDLADNELKTYVISQFVISADHNTFVNDRKLSVLFKCKKCLIISLIFNVIALFPYMHAFINKSDEVHKVELSNKSHKVEIQVKDEKRQTEGMKRPGEASNKTLGGSIWEWILPSKSTVIPSKSSLATSKRIAVPGVTLNFSKKKSRRKFKSAIYGKYLPVNNEPLKFDSAGKPCPPKGRIMIEGEYPEEPLNYKSLHEEK